jgi:hypothetical protein
MAEVPHIASDIDLSQAARLIASLRAARSELNTLSKRIEDFTRDVEEDLSDLGVTMDKIAIDLGVEKLE